jgi:hypothetical protein
MSELIQSRDADIRRRLLATASAFALVTYIASTDFASAEDAARPTVWIELGGQLERTQGTTGPFSAPFMALTPSSNVYEGVPFIDSQKQGRFAFGAEGKIVFQPKDSDWKFAAGIRYGRSNATRKIHNQTVGLPPLPFSFTSYGYVYASHTATFPPVALADTRTRNAEQHVILDFTTGKDIGIGMFGRSGTSTIEAGVRFASFVSHSTAFETARPEIGIGYRPKYGGIVLVPRPTFYQYTMSASADRSFRGIGPSLSWSASSNILGNEDLGALTFDWGVNAALLFGKQKAQTEHTTKAYHLTTSDAYPQVYYHRVGNTRSRSVVVPNLGGFAGFSVKYPNVQVSLGYRADFFFGAMDAGIDSRSTKDVGFHGPFATVSIGLGG